MKPTSCSQASSGLAASITKAASHQTYYTILLLADRERREDAFRAYAYFRWVDDVLDAPGSTQEERARFLERQKELVAACYQGSAQAGRVTPKEQILIDLVSSDQRRSPRLWTYLNSMMAVMEFDARRRGRLISERELAEYTANLASAVTEAMHHFIGHKCPSPQDETRYLAVSAAHITHMLRDMADDIAAGYYNIPREVLQAGAVPVEDIHSAPYRAWIKSRVEQAREYFRTGRLYLGRVQNPRCRLAGFAYCSRFEGVLDAIERDGYRLRAAYPECKGLPALLRASGAVLQGITERQKIYKEPDTAQSGERSLKSL